MNDALRNALIGTTCVHAWTGYGDPLFATFRRDGNVPAKPRREREAGSLELQTNFSDWLVSISNGDSDGGPDGGDPPNAAERLVGKKVVHARLTDDCGLRIIFQGGTELSVTPWRDEQTLTDAWSIDLDNGSTLAAPTFGRPRLVKSTAPMREWFTADP